MIAGLAWNDATTQDTPAPQLAERHAGVLDTPDASKAPWHDSVRASVLFSQQPKSAAFPAVKISIFRNIKTSPEVIRLAVLMYIQFSFEAAVSSDCAPRHMPDSRYVCINPAHRDYDAMLNPLD